MFGLISKAKLTIIIKELYNANNGEHLTGRTDKERHEDYYFQMGCCNVCNYLKNKFKLKIK